MRTTRSTRANWRSSTADILMPRNYLNGTCMPYCRYVYMIIFLCCIVRKAHRLKGMCIYIHFILCNVMYFVIQVVS